MYSIRKIYGKRWNMDDNKDIDKVCQITWTTGRCSGCCSRRCSRHYSGRYSGHGDYRGISTVYKRGKSTKGNFVICGFIEYRDEIWKAKTNKKRGKATC